MAHTVTTRDLKVVHFFEDHPTMIMTAKQIAKMFYSDNCKSERAALVVARDRLKILTEKKYLKRVRESVGMEYIYYMSKKPPKKLEHKLKMIDFIIAFNGLKNIELLEFKTEWDTYEKDYGIRPDIRIEFMYNGGKQVALVEIDLQKTFTNTDKYKEIVKARKEDYRIAADLPRGRTSIISVCDTPPPTNELKVFWCKADMTYLEQFTDKLR